MKTKLSLALLLIATGAAGCHRSSDDGLDANIASAFYDYAANQQNAGAPESIFPDGSNDDTTDNGSDDLNEDMSEAANISVAIGAAQGVMGEGTPDPDGSPASSGGAH